MDRPEITIKDADRIKQELYELLIQRLYEKGKHIYASCHETSGILGEEWDEFKEAVHENNQPKQRKELMDLAVGCMMGIISIDSGKMDW